MSNDTEFTLSLIRHGESAVNATPDIIGQLPSVPLTEKGEKQANALRERFLKSGENFDLIYSSPYVRALNTAKLAIPDLKQEIILAPELREYNAGDWISKSRSQIFDLKMKSEMNIMNHMFLPPNGESFAMVERRASKWLDETILYNEIVQNKISTRKEDEPAINIACFSHGMTIKCLLHYIVGFDNSFVWKISINNTSITKLSFGKDGWKLLCVNDCYHIEGL